MQKRDTDTLIEKVYPEIDFRKLTQCNPKADNFIAKKEQIRLNYIKGGHNLPSSSAQCLTSQPSYVISNPKADNFIAKKTK